MILIKSNHKHHIVIGDIHGELQGLKEILKHAKLIDRNDSWSGRDVVLVQTGDVIDRGPHSIKCVAFLRKLQQQAIQMRKGKVVRLCGNHELMVLQGNYRYVNFPHPEIFAEELTAEIKAGAVRAAYTDGKRMFTHAGLRSGLRERLMAEIIPDALALETEDVDLDMLTERINNIFKKRVRSGELHGHPLFNVDRERGGRDPFGGIFWGDYSLISESERAWKVPQIFGHTPSGKNNVQHKWDLNLINVDAGMCEHYGGFRVYLEIDAKETIVEYSKKKTGHWGKTVLTSRSVK